MKKYITLLLTGLIGLAQAQTNIFEINGNVGIGTAAPIGRLDVRGNSFVGTSDLVLGTRGSFVQIDQGAATGDSYTQIRAFNNGGNSFSNLVLQNGGGNVGIGIADTKGYKLAVAGSIISESVVVRLQGSWPDYVFTKGYQLPELSETEKYIRANGHLPGIPSAEEVKKNGINLEEMNCKLLKKIEELTLHLVEQAREMKEMKEEIRILKNK